MICLFASNGAVSINCEESLERTPITMSNPSDLLELSRHLKQERLFITSERDQLQSLNENVRKSAERLCHLAWIARQQKVHLDQMILANKEVTPEVCCRRINGLESATFIDGYRQLTYHESKIGDFLKYLREHPKLVATCLVEAERNSHESLRRMAQIFMSGVFGNIVMPEDEALVLRVLKCLVDMQVAFSDNPRRLLRKGTCAFSVIFKQLNEGMFSAKLFLTAALHKPVMQLLMEDEWFYDIDPDRALYRFPPQERLKRFGKAGTDEHRAKTKQYREVTNKKLVMLAERFIRSIKSNLYCFPQSLAWIVAHLYQSITKCQSLSATDARALCAELVFAGFICPAICDPEPFGITSDAPISYIARHNLMQVAQMLQVLALSTWEEIEQKTRDLYGKFDKGCMAFLLESLLESPASDQPQQQLVQLSGPCRAAVLMPCTDLLHLMNLMGQVSGALEESSQERQQLESVLSNLPPPATLQAMQPRPRSPVTPAGEATPPGTPGTGKRSKSIRDKTRLFLSPDHTASSDPDALDSSHQMAPLEDVLVISLGVVNECPGLLPESKVLEQENKQRKFNSLIPGEDDPVSESDIPLHEKRTRFSLSHDQDSIATSDNLEAISEAASSHSVGSDLDNENDNLSDMVSANVSGRGTPNISGRDTPISQAEEGPGEGGEGLEERANGPSNLPVIVTKTNREDVTDRFGKFDIKQELERDETKSTVSDTWSTDVLASDSEPPEQNQYERLSEVAEEMARANLLLGVQEVSELCETGSEAWSVDVLTSDTSERQSERLRELEQDETGSISSRSQAQDSELGDQLDQGENTPQASGRQSPRDEMSTDVGPELLPVAAGISSRSRPPGALGPRLLTSAGGSGYPDVSGAFQAEGPRRALDRITDRAFGNVGNRNKTPREGGGDAKSNDGKEDDVISRNSKHASDLTAAYDKMEERKLDYMRSEWDRAAVKYPDGLVGLVPDLLDDSQDSSDDGQCERQTSQDRLDADGQLCSQELMTASNDTLKLAEPGETSDFHFAHTPNRGSASSLVEALANEVSGGLKLTEQQNFNIDANRLSAVVSIFDPLLEGGVGAAAEERARRLSEPAGFGGHVAGASASASGAYGRNSYSELGGARPKMAGGDHPQPPPPRIAFQSPDSSFSRPMPTSMAAGPDRPLTASSLRQSGSGGQGSPRSKTGPVVDFDLGKFSQDAVSGSTRSDPDIVSSSLGVPLRRAGAASGQGSGSGSGSASGSGSSTSSLQNGDVIQKSRCGPDASAWSSLVELPAPGPASGGAPALPRPAHSEGSLLRDEDSDPDRRQSESKKKTSFFHSFKERLSKGGKRKVNKAYDREDSTNADRESSAMGSDHDESFARPRSGHNRTSEDPSQGQGNESTDDILAKYRRPHASPLKSAGDDSASSPSNAGGKDAKSNSLTRGGEDGDEGDAGPPAYDPANLENCKAFLDAKKKLRLVLSNADFHSMPSMASCCAGGGSGGGGGGSGGGGGGGGGGAEIVGGNSGPGGGFTVRQQAERRENDLVGFLKVQLAEAINLQDKDLIAQLHETIRCLRQFDNNEIKKLLKTMREEYRGRSPYVSYLVRCRQGLLTTLAHLDRLLNRVHRDKAVCNKYFLAVFVRLFLEKKERNLMRFLADFQKLTVSDEKTDLVERFLEYVYGQMEDDPLWFAATVSQIQDAKLYIERNVMGHVYTHAMYPNGDGDICRDQILHEHIDKLSQVITPNHKDLRIPKIYHYECPWPAAQAEIYMINAFKTPKDKLQCVLRCSSTIMNLLSMANEKGVPAADDFTPVLIFVLIKANPPSLLSTVQYVTSFYGKRLAGEEQYWWMQFAAAIEFIKTMDYGE